MYLATGEAGVPLWAVFEPTEVLLPQSRRDGVRRRFEGQNIKFGAKQLSDGGWLDAKGRSPWAVVRKKEADVLSLGF